MCLSLYIHVFCRRYYIEKYNLEGQVLPHTAILDPRTGAPLLKVSVGGGRVCDLTASRSVASSPSEGLKVSRQLVQ